MSPSSPIALRPRRATELLDAAFVIYRLRARPFLTTSALIMLPQVTMRLLWPELSRWVVFPVTWLTSVVLGGALIVMVADVLHGRADDMGRAIRIAFTRSHRLVGTFILSLLLFAAGVVFFIVPGVLAWAALFACYHAVVLEDADVSGAMSRSWQLTSERVWRTAGTLFVALLIPMALSMVATLIPTWLAAVKLVPMTVPRVAEQVMGIVTAPFGATFTTLLYFDLRVRKEGLDLDLLVDELSASPLAQTEAAYQRPISEAAG